MSVPTDLQIPSVVRQADGRITGPDGRPVAAALIAVIDLASYRAVGFEVSDRDGRFSVGLPSSQVVITATANDLVAASLAPVVGKQLSLVLSKPAGATRRFAGTVVGSDGHPLARVRVRLMNWGWPLGAAYYTSSDEAGRFQFLVDSEGSYDLMVDDRRYVSNFASMLGHGADRALLTAYDRGQVVAAAGRADEAALRDLCVPLTEHGVRQLAGSLRTARVVGLGESTHGTSEFTEVRRSIIGELARDGWLTSIAVEASWEEVARLDDYVRRGTGTGRDAVRSLAYWPWRTEQFLALVESVRTLNDGLPADRKIEFLGIDYAPPGATVAFVHRYCESEGLPCAGLFASLDPLRRIVSWDEISKLSLKEREALLSSLEELRRIAERQPRISLPAIQGLRITELIVDASRRDEDFRDPVMAEAVLALLARSDKERRVAIWAHSQHLAQGPLEGAVPMGQYLRTRLAEGYRAVGTLFYKGSFRTFSGLQEKMVNHVAALPPPFYLESVMDRVSPSGACVLDVTEATRRADVRDWISAPMHVRIYGGLEISESYPWPPVHVPDLWSALIFVPSTTPATPLD